MSRFIGVSDNFVNGLSKVGGIVKSAGNSPVGGKLVFGQELLNEIFLRELRYPIFNSANKRFVTGKFAAAVNHLNIGDFGLRASTTDGSGKQTNEHKAMVDGFSDVIKLRPFDDILVENWFERIELETRRETIIDLISEKLVRDASAIALYSDDTNGNGGTFTQFKGWATQGTKLETSPVTWRAAIDESLGLLDNRAHQNADKIHIIVPSSKRVEIYRQLVANNVIMEDKYNSTGSVKYMNFNLEFDSTLDFTNVELNVHKDVRLVVAYEGVHEIVYSEDETVYEEVNYGRTVEQFFGTYFAPVIRNKNLFVSVGLGTPVNPVDIIPGD